MKYRNLILVLILFFILCLCLPEPAVGAEESALPCVAQAQETSFAQAEDSSSPSLGEYTEELLDNLDTEELESYIASLRPGDNTPLKDKLLKLALGEFDFSYDSLAESVLSVLGQNLRSLVPSLAVIAAVCVLCGILTSMQNGFIHQGVATLVRFTAFASVTAVLLTHITECVAQTFTATAEMQKQMQIVFPLLLTLMSSSGGTVSAAVYRPTALFLSQGITSLMTQAVLPCSVIILVLDIVGHISPSVRLNNLAGVFRSVNKWIIGLSVTLFSLFLTIQGITSATYDGISFRAIRYAIGNTVPIVGGFVSGGFDMLVAGSVLIKNAVGTCGVFMLFSVILAPVLALAALHILLRIVAAVAEPIGEGGLSAFFTGLSADIQYFTAVLFCVGFLYFLTNLLLVCSAQTVV